MLPKIYKTVQFLMISQFEPFLKAIKQQETAFCVYSEVRTAHSKPATSDVSKG